MQKRIFGDGIIAHLRQVLRWGVVTFLISVPVAHGSNIQVSADGSYAPPQAEAESDAAETGRQDALPRILSSSQPTATAATLLPKDLVFVIDNSGSMKQNDPGFTIKTVVARFMEQLTAGDRCGLIIFDSRARLISPLMEIQTAGALDELKRGLDQVECGARQAVRLGL